jgi:hypothetical protein
MQAGYRRRKGVGSLTREKTRQRATNQRHKSARSQTKSWRGGGGGGGGRLSEKPLQAEPTKSNKQAKEAVAEKGRRGKKIARKGQKGKK